MVRLVHQPAFGVNEYRHPFMIVCFCLFAGGSALGAGLGLNTGRDGNRGCRRVKLPAGEFIISALVFKKYYLAECLGARLKTES